MIWNRCGISLTLGGSRERPDTNLKNRVFSSFVKDVSVSHSHWMSWSFSSTPSRYLSVVRDTHSTTCRLYWLVFTQKSLFSKTTMPSPFLCLVVQSVQCCSIPDNFLEHHDVNFFHAAHTLLEVLGSHERQQWDRYHG